MNPKGFTIIELLIATVTFSVVLLIITGSIIQFTKLYYKGTVTTQTQEVARAVIDDIAKNIRFAAPGSIQMPDPVGELQRLCIGGQRYLYQFDTQVSGTGTAAKHALVVDSADSGCLSPDGGIDGKNLGSDQIELLGDRMQLLDLSVVQIEKQYIIKVKIGYGDEFQADGSCPSVSIGGQFCASSELSTTVIGRL